MLEEYRKHVAERAAEGIAPKPLDANQMAALVELLKTRPRRRRIPVRSVNQPCSPRRR